MGTSCRITKLKPPCQYTVEGITRVLLLDYADFLGFRFRNKDLYNDGFVTAILRSGNYIELNAPDMVAKYNSTAKYVHVLESFTGTLEAEVIQSLHLGTKRRYVVVFVGNNGKWFTFGYEAGASLSYTNQTAEGFGSMVTLTAPSEFPLFETTAEAVNSNEIIFTFRPDFEGSAYCRLDAVQQATRAYKESLDGEPLDIDGRLISESEKRQAIALIYGAVNPNPTLYEVQLYYYEGAAIFGVPTVQINFNACPITSLYIYPTRIILTAANPTASVVVSSTSDWHVVNPPIFSTFDILGSTAGTSTIQVTRTETLGQEDIEITNGAKTVKLRIINVENTDGWILETGYWDNLAFWKDNGIWNF